MTMLLKNVTQKEVLDILSDWSLHSKEEIQATTGASFNAIRIQICKLRKKLQAKDKDIIAIRVRKTSFYRLVSFRNPESNS